MGLKEDLLTMPLEARFAYDAERNMFFLNMEGMSLVSADEVEAIGTAVGKRLAAIGKKVQMVVNYDNFYLDPALTDNYVSVVRRLAERPLRQRARSRPAPSCGSSSPGSCTTGTWPRTSMKAAKKP